MHQGFQEMAFWKNVKQRCSSKVAVSSLYAKESMVKMALSIYILGRLSQVSLQIPCFGVTTRSIQPISSSSLFGFVSHRRRQRTIALEILNISTNPIQSMPKPTSNLRSLNMPYHIMIETVLSLSKIWWDQMKRMSNLESRKTLMVNLQAAVFWPSFTNIKRSNWVKSNKKRYSSRSSQMMHSSKVTCSS